MNEFRKSWFTAAPGRIEIQCGHCARTMWLGPSQAKRYLTCSVECAKKRYASIEPPTITQAVLQALVRYEPESGFFYRLTAGGGKKVGDLCGGANSLGYWTIYLGGKSHLAHRLAWLYVTGEWPETDVDHIDGFPGNNRWSNLRCVSHQINMQNRRRPSAGNKSGLLGVVPSGNKWTAQVKVNGRRHCFGSFETPEAAHEAYVVGKRELHEGCTL